MNGDFGNTAILPGTETLIEQRDNPLFQSDYPHLIRACQVCGINTIHQLWKRYCVAAEKIHAEGFIDQGTLERFSGRMYQSVFYHLISGKKDERGVSVSPWDMGRKKYKIQAILVGMALNRHPRYVFGPPGDLIEKLAKIYNRPTPQYEHIRNLMRQAFNPLTRRRGLTNYDVRQLASTPELKVRTLHLCFHDDSYDRQITKAFTSVTGEPKTWAADFAAILDMPTEEVFKYEAIQLVNRRKQIASEQKEVKRLNLDDRFIFMLDPFFLAEAGQLNAAQRIVDNSPRQTTETEKDVKIAVSRALFLLGDKEKERILRLRFGIGLSKRYTLEQVGKVFGFTKEWIRQIEGDALEILRKNEKKTAFNDDADSIASRRIEFSRQLYEYEREEYRLLRNLDLKRKRSGFVLRKFEDDLKKHRENRPNEILYGLTSYYVPLKPFLK